MATIRKKRDKWCVEIRRSFHKHISKTFISKNKFAKYRFLDFIIIFEIKYRKNPMGGIEKI